MVADDQEVVAHTENPTFTVAETFTGAKFIPASVTVAPPLAGPLKN